MSILQNINGAEISSWSGVNVSSNNYLDQGHCLFRFVHDGYCNSAMLSTPIYLDLGGALAAFGLLFAVYQLRNPKWDTALKIRDAWQRHLFWILGIIGLALVLARVLITQIPVDYLSYPFNVPILYELLAYVFFVASPLSLMYFGQRSKHLFKERTARKFYEVLIAEVSRSDEKWIDAALEVLMRNFDDICKSIAENEPRTEISGSARAIIDVVLSEESIVKILTTKRLDALQRIFYTIKKYHINRNQCDVGIPALVRNLFLDETSFFYKHLNRDGLALSLNIYESIFESPILLTNFNLFGYPTLGYSARNNSGIAMKVFIQALSKSIATYLKTGKGSVRYINDGLEYLSDAFGNICMKISTEEGRGVDTRYSLEDEWWTLHDIAHFLGHDYPFLVYQDTLNQITVDTEKTASEAGFYSDLTINAGIAAVLYKAFEQLAYLRKTTDIYHTVLQLLNGMMYHENYKEGYRNPFEKRLWEQIAKNVSSKHYPNVLRIYLTFMGFMLTSDDTNQRQGWIGGQTERMRRLLYVDLKPLLDRGEKMVNDELMIDVLLPEWMKYKDGKFSYTNGFGRGDTKVITEPPAGSASALVGVDMDNRSSLL